jgi:hypothetical protein
MAAKFGYHCQVADDGATESATGARVPTCSALATTGQGRLRSESLHLTIKPKISHAVKKLPTYRIGLQ